MAEALVVIGGWFASAAVSKLFDSICSIISSRYKITTDVKRKLKSMESNLGKIKVVVEAIESKVSEDKLVSWLNELKDVVYDAEDILDILNYESHRGSDWREFARKAHSAFRPSDTLRGLSDIVNRFDSLLKDNQITSYIGLATLVTESSEQRQTTYAKISAEPFGRSTEKDQLRELVLGSPNEIGSNGENFSVVSIVGMGGVGKTTLAQWLFNHEDVRGHFNRRAWVCVSDKFSTKRVMTEIIESASTLSSIPIDQGIYTRINVASIQEDLSKLLSGAMFLIVLDDVWEDMTDDYWEQLINAFKSGKKGSKMTRDTTVANKVNSMATVNFTGLEKEEYWQFFKRCAFGHVDPNDHPKLKCIGKQIADKLGGLPLAAKVVGGVLKSKLEEKFWRDFLENKEWQKNSNIRSTLKWSYNHLPPHLKQCFAYCALFPKDYRFNIDQLVHIWVAHEYVQPQSSYEPRKTMEDIGREYFNELLNRSFFEYFSQKEFVIHDLLHDLAETITDGEIYRVENDSSMKLENPNRVRHLFVSSPDLASVLDHIIEPKKLRSLVYCPPFSAPTLSYQTLNSDFKKVQSLRVLILGNHLSVELPETIGHMFHLRYLEFPFKPNPKLPISLGRLYNLQVLACYKYTQPIIDYGNSDDPIFQPMGITKLDFAQYCETLFDRFNKQTVKSEIFGKLTNLRYVNAHHFCIPPIPGIGKLTSLQRLISYEVREQEGHRICELRNLNKLHGCLIITNLQNVANKEEAEKVELNNKAHLEVLGLGWNKSYCSNGEFRVHEQILEGFRPHSNIKIINISGYKGLKLASWLNKSSLPNIESIFLSHFEHLKALPPLGEFPFLKFLSLKSLCSLEKIGLEAYGGGDKVFPLLQRLKLDHLKELREWSSFKEDACDMMPRLSTIEITNCEKLEALPPLERLQCLVNLYISDCPNLKVIPPLGELPSLAFLSLQGLDSLEKIGVEIYGRGNIAFPSLEKLQLSIMRGLREWCAIEEQSQDLMPRLISLYIFDCPKLKVIPLLGELPSLKEMELKELDSLEKIGVEIYGRESIAFPSLEKLRLSNMSGLREWCAIEEQSQDLMPRLISLYISHCPKLKVIPPLGELPSLIEMKLQELDSLEKISVEIYGQGSIAFPSLEKLELSSMSGLIEWCAVEEQSRDLMPHLISLYISDCPKLKVIPPLGELSSLKEMELEDLDSLEKIGVEIYGRGSIAFPSLEKLELSSMRGLTGWCAIEEQSRDWMPRLISLYIYKCPRLKVIPPLGELPSLKEMKFKDLNSLEKIGVEIYGWGSIAFPSLEKLELSSMSGLTEWCAIEEQSRDLMPRLISLNIFNCPSLKVIPPLGELPSLAFLDLSGLLEKIGVKIYGRGSTTFPSLEKLTLSSMSGLRDWCAIEEQSRDLMPRLISLDIANCPKLKVIPPLGELPSLKEMVLRDLDSLKKIGVEIYGRESIAFPSLKKLQLIYMSGLTEWCVVEEQVQDLMPHLTSLIISNCPKLKVIPPLGELPSLAFLSLKRLDSLKKIGVEIYGRGSIAFPSLEKLELSSMRGLTRWCAIEEQSRDWMPRLISLYIYKCTRLKVIPPLGELPSLKEMELKELDSLEKISVEIYGRESIAFPSLEKLRVSQMSELRDWCAVKERSQNLMPRLIFLKISNCRKLKIIPPLGKMPSQKVDFLGCLEMVKLRGDWKVTERG